MPVPAACLFDLDGLLLDTEPLHGRAWAEAAAQFGTQLSPAQLLDLRGRRRRDCAEQVVHWVEAPIRCEQLLEVQQPIAKQLLPTAAANAGAEELIAWCIATDLPMALVTSSGRESFDYKTGAHPWIHQIRTRVLGDDPELKAGKPAPDPYLLAAQRLGIAPEQCWAFEDSAAGCRAALAANCELWVLNPNGENLDLKESPPDKPWHSIHSLHAVLEQLRQS
ncbi:MAG: HAD family hydrolase [Synechococcus sp.]